jgi:hypothetical protein
MSRHQALVHAGLAGLVIAGSGCSFDAPAIGDARPLDGPPDVPRDTEPMIERVKPGLVAFWRFDEASGDRANDSRMELVAGPALAPIPLPISDPASVTWGGGGLRLDAPVRAGTALSTHVNYDVLATGEVTMEAWVSPAMTSQGGAPLPSRLPNYALVLSISPGYAYHNAMIAQVGDRWQGRVLTAATTSNALPVIETPPGTITGTGPVHLVLVASATERVMYVNGTAYRAPPPGTGVGPLNAPPPAQRWFDYFPISIGQERDTGEKRPWLGTIWLAAIYDRALTEGEVQTNLRARHDCAGC